ncbi:MAG: hypothetical protein GY804_05350 [Alphaproteobacteria bacterium]|nr:hypothetical protein [Alphaproteobacteria bacterium]
MRKGDVETVKTIIGHDAFKNIKDIADNDPKFIDFKKWILGHPDMTEKDHEQQALDLYKFRIEQEGYNNVLNFYTDFLQNSKDTKGLVLLKGLKAWSEENGYMEDKFTRNGLEKPVS